MRHKWRHQVIIRTEIENLYFKFGSAHRYLEVFKGIVVLVGGVDTVENPLHPHPYNDLLVEHKVHGARFACAQAVHDQKTYIVVIPRIKRVIRNPIRVIP